MSRAAATAAPPTPRRRPAPARDPQTAARPTAAPTARQTARRATRRGPFFVVAALVVGTLAAAIVSLQAIVSQTSFHMQALEQQTQQLEQRYGQLKLTVAQLSSPERVAAAASRMGLRLPTDVHTITIPGLGAAAGSRHGRGATSFALKSILGEHP